MNRITPIPRTAELFARPPAPAGNELPVRSVREVAALLGHVVNQGLPSTMLVSGEISNWKASSNGHVFFVLKDGTAELPCVIWRADVARMSIHPSDGMQVVAQGQVRVYETQCRVQFYVTKIVPQGYGELEKAFRALVEKLRQEGLFDGARKRRLPRLPRRVAIITSRTGHVLHDVLQTAWRRCPCVHMLLLPLPVQGAGAAQKLAAGIALLNAHNQRLEIDLILLVRGGGSLEDLWCFNEECLARAIVASTIPVATGIGHEPDTTIADLVADLRGATPTGITEMVLPEAQALNSEIDAAAGRLSRALQRNVQTAGHELRQRQLELNQAMRANVATSARALEELCAAVQRIEPRYAIAQGARRADEYQNRLLHAARKLCKRKGDLLENACRRLVQHHPAAALRAAAVRLSTLEGASQSSMGARLRDAAATLDAAERHLHALNPQAVLDRGYSITRTADGKVVRSSTQVARGDRLVTRVAEGQINSVVGKPRQGSLF